MRLPEEVVCLRLRYVFSPLDLSPETLSMKADKNRLKALGALKVPFAFRVLLAKSYAKCGSEKEYLYQRYLDGCKYINTCGDPQCFCGDKYSWTIPFTKKVKRRRDGSLKEKHYLMTLITSGSVVVNCQMSRV